MSLQRGCGGVVWRGRNFDVKASHLSTPRSIYKTVQTHPTRYVNQKCQMFTESMPPLLPHNNEAEDGHMSSQEAISNPTTTRYPAPRRLIRGYMADYYLWDIS